MDAFFEFFVAAFVTFFAMWFIMPIIMFLLRQLGLYTIVQEGTCQVFVLFGKVICILKEPGLHILPFKLGLNAFLIRWMGNEAYNLSRSPLGQVQPLPMFSR